MGDIEVREKELYDSVVLYSGGADSCLMLNMLLELGKRPLCLLIDYGQKHVKELEYAKKQLHDLGVVYTKVSLVNYNVNSGLTGDNVEGQYDGVSVYNVPARNSIFLSIAAGIAEANNVKDIYIGCDMSDFYGEFPDCKQEYIGKMNEVFKIAFSYPITISAPLLGITKEFILETLEKKYNIKKSDLHSGYEEYNIDMM